MTIKEFLKARQGLLCITGHVSKIANYPFDDHTTRRVYWFPENGLHVDDQALFVKRLRSPAGIIITHSAFIVSDFRPENVLVIPMRGVCDHPEFNTFGASVNKINMCLFNHPSTVSALAEGVIKELAARPRDTLEQIKETIDASRCLGDSIERTLLYHDLINRENELKGVK